MRIMGAFEAESRFRELLADVAKGETIVVTEHDVPVAQISPVHKNQGDTASAVDEWRRYRRERNLTLGEGVTIRELIDEGRE